MAYTADQQQEIAVNPRLVLSALITTFTLAGLASCGGSDAGYTVGGTVTGSFGPVVLQLNDGNDITLNSPGAFSFPVGLKDGAAFDVKVSAAQNCNVSSGNGTVAAANVTSVVISCTTVVRTATLSGATESPAVVTAASGRGAVVVNPTTKEITGGISFTGLTPNAGAHHIHQAPSGNAAGNGPVIIGLTLGPDGKTASVPAGTKLTDAQYAALLAGELYMNVHTAANPGGEIRGQINLRGGVTVGLAALDAAQEVPVGTSTATGRGTLVFDNSTREVIVAYVTHSVSAPTIAHIHTGAKGVSGPANVITFARGTNFFSAASGAALTAQGAIDVAAGNTYFNVHSSTVPAGEIRGQVVIQ